MRRAERTYVATAFVPFRRRRVDAVAARLVSELRALGIDAERLRLPVTMTEQGAAGSAAAASLVNLSWAHNVICLEFPCLHVVADRMSAFRVRGGLDDHLLRHDVVTRTPASRFAPDLVEPGATAGWSSAPVCMPPGLLSIDLRDRGVITDAADRLLVVSLHESCAPVAQQIADAAPAALVIQEHSEGVDDEGPEARLWRALEGPLPGPFRAVHVVVPATDGAAPQWVPEFAGADEAWTIVGSHGARSVTHDTGDSRAEWSDFALGLLP